MTACTDTTTAPPSFPPHHHAHASATPPEADEDRQRLVRGSQNYSFTFDHSGAWQPTKKNAMPPQIGAPLPLQSNCHPSLTSSPPFSFPWLSRSPFQTQADHRHYDDACCWHGGGIYLASFPGHAPTHHHHGRHQGVPQAGRRGGEGGGGGRKEGSDGGAWRSEFDGTRGDPETEAAAAGTRTRTHHDHHHQGDDDDDNGL